MPSFAEFGLLPSLQTYLSANEFKTPTEIQLRAVPAFLAGRSIVGVAETGSGKTLAYVLPLLHMLKTLENSGKQITAAGQPRAVVVVPARELGEQVLRVFKPFTHTTRLRVRGVLGGTTMEIAKRDIKGPFEILVATPGRLIKLLEQGLLNLGDVRVLVFDEVDQMLDPGFLPDAERVVKACPADRQMALFTATLSPTVEKLVEKLFADAEVVRSDGSHRTVATLTTQNRTVVDGKRFALLERVLRENVAGGTMIFTNTRAQCDKVAAEIEQSGRQCVVYRGEMDKAARRANLKAFRAGTIRILVSTDLAARGLDVDHVERVINYHLPEQMENYLHRVGRTARAGRAGLVINFVTERDRALVDRLEDVKATSRRQ